MTAPRHAPAAASVASQGFILVAVLWILGALAAFVSIYALYIGNTAAAAAARDEAVTTRSLATAAVELAAFRLVSVPKAERASRGEIRFRMGKARIFAVFQDETARIDLNTAPPELLAGLFTVLGAQPSEATRYAQRIVGWRGPPADLSDQGQEAGLYRDAGIGYMPRAAPFVHAEEIWRVADLPPALVEAALPYVTVFSGRPMVNLHDADPLVRAAAAATPEPAVAPGEEAPAPADAVKPSDAVRVSVRIDFDGRRSRFLEAVILVRAFADAPYRLLSWREDAAPSAALARTGGRP